MIKEILETIARRGVVSRRELAESLGVDEATLEDMLRLLVAKGYLKRIMGTGNCARCPLRALCPYSSCPTTRGDSGAPVMYVLTVNFQFYRSDAD